MYNPTKLFLTTLLLFVTVNTFGQNLNQQQLIGTWSIVNIEDTVLTDSEKQNLQTFLNAFKKSTFELEPNNDFTLHMDSKKIDEDYMKQLHWKYNQNQSKVIVQDWKNKDNSEEVLMELDVKSNMGKIFFHASAPPLVFKIKKESGGGKKNK